MRAARGNGSPIGRPRPNAWRPGPGGRFPEPAREGLPRRAPSQEDDGGGRGAAPRAAQHWVAGGDGGAVGGAAGGSRAGGSDAAVGCIGSKMCPHKPPDPHTSYKSPHKCFLVARQGGRGPCVERNMACGMHQRFDAGGRMVALAVKGINLLMADRVDHGERMGSPGTLHEACRRTATSPAHRDVERATWRKDGAQMWQRGMPLRRPREPGSSPAHLDSYLGRAATSGKPRGATVAGAPSTPPRALLSRAPLLCTHRGGMAR